MVIRKPFPIIVQKVKNTNFEINAVFRLKSHIQNVRGVS